MNHGRKSLVQYSYTLIPTLMVLAQSSFGRTPNNRLGCYACHNQFVTIIKLQFYLIQLNFKKYILQMVNEVESWPYTFPASEDFLSSAQRGKVEGRLLVRDRQVSYCQVLSHYDSNIGTSRFTTKLVQVHQGCIRPSQWCLCGISSPRRCWILAKRIQGNLLN